MSKFTISMLLCGLVWETRMQSGADGDNMDVFRLPGTTRPEFYDLKFIPNFNGTESTFSGVAKIIVVCNENTDEITLNVEDLSVTNVSVEDISGELSIDLKVLGWTCVNRNEQLVIRVDSDIVPNNKYLMTLSYDGRIRNDMSGWYMSAYDECDQTK